MITIEAYVNFYFIRWIKYHVNKDSKHKTFEVLLLTAPWWDFDRSFLRGHVITESER